MRALTRWARRAAVSGTAALTALAGFGAVATARSAAASVPAATATGAAASALPATVVILVAGFGSSVSASTYDPLTEGSPALTDIDNAFDPTNEPPTCDAVPDLTTTLTTAGALILPFSYNGATLTGPADSPTMTVSAYGNSIPGNSPSQTLPSVVTPYLAAEVSQVHGLWPSANVVIVGHSEGGYVAESYFASNLFSTTQDPEVTGIFSLDSPINGVQNEKEAGDLLSAIGDPASPALLGLFKSSWDNAYKDGASDDLNVLGKEGGTALYVPVGTPGDNIYRLADSPEAGLVSQVLVDSTGQPVFSSSYPNFLDPATPPKAGITKPLAVLASHQCVMDNAAVIAEIAARVTSGSIPLNPVTSPDAGYRLAASDGGLFAFGGAGFDGSLGGMHLNAPVVGVAAAPDGGGYWLVGSDGGVYAFGDAAFDGSLGSLRLNEPIVGMAATPDGGGYWLVGSDGGVYAFGDAAFDGSLGSLRLNEPIVGMAATPDGGGYWLVGSDGGVYAFGDAAFDGSMGGTHLNAPVVGMAAAPDGGGYTLVGSDGGVYVFGDAGFDGSLGSLHLNKPIVGVAATPNGGGYWLVGSDGGIFCFGDATFDGSLGGVALNQPIVGLTPATS